MPRGRPRLYHTEEEKVIANRAKSTRSYRKRKDPLNLHKPVRFRQKVERKLQGVLPGSTQAGLPEGVDPTDLNGWMELLSATSKQYEDYKNGSVRHFVDQLCIKYLNTTRSNHIFEEALLEICGFDNVIARCHKNVLQLAGVGVELKALELIQRGVWECEAGLVDASGYAMLGHAEFTEMREKGKLTHQSYAN
ncbi:hypothetical protein ONZ45_g8579 [Pleurotus djamor]|nr:hypothetical protein ONZ45_g8579 [Pleurotus djamor]